MAFVQEFYGLKVDLKKIVYSFSSDFLVDENYCVVSELRTDVLVPYPGSTGCIDRGDSFFTTWHAAKGFEEVVGRTETDRQAYKVSNHSQTPFSETRIFMERYGRGVRADGIKLNALPIHPFLLSRGLEFLLEYERKRYWIVAKQFGQFSDEKGTFRETEIRLESNRPGKNEPLVLHERLTDGALIQSLEDDVKWAFWSSMKLLTEIGYSFEEKRVDELLHDASWGDW